MAIYRWDELVISTSTTDMRITNVCRSPRLISPLDENRAMTSIGRLLFGRTLIVFLFSCTILVYLTGLHTNGHGSTSCCLESAAEVAAARKRPTMACTRL